MIALRVGVGLLIVLSILWEVFHDLFNPSGNGALSDFIGRTIFSVLRQRKSVLSIAGPLALVLTIVVWMLGLVVGFAFIYSADFPNAFRTSSSGTVPPDHAVLVLGYFSFETLVTLGYGDIVPHLATLRFVATIEALLGFALLTASVSSIVLIYPALSRMRALALGVSHLVQGERRTGLSPARVDSDLIVADLAREVTQARIDLVHYPITFFFAPANEDASVAKWTAVLSRYAREASSPDRPSSVRVAGASLDAALDGLAELFARHLRGSAPHDREDVFIAVATTHRVNRAA